MIVYNVQRRWFTEKVMADKYRIAAGLPPKAVLKVAVESRPDLVNLLNALCDPPERDKPVPAPATDELVDRAYVKATKDIPDYIPQFLRKDGSVS